MVSFKCFSSILNSLNTLNERSLEVYNNTNGYVDLADFYAKESDSILDALMEEMGDKDTAWISYWMYDCDFGRDEKLTSSVSFDSVKVPFKTMEDLYNVLIENNRRNNEPI